MKKASYSPLWRSYQHNLIRIIQQIQPDRICNLGAQSHVSVSFEGPEYTANSDAPGTKIFKQWNTNLKENQDISGEY